MIRVTKNIVIPDRDLDFSFTRSSGPGGQHVNTSDTAVQLRFDIENTDALPPPVAARLRAQARNRIGADGQLLIAAGTHRSRQRNIEEAVARLTELVRRAAVPPKRRRPTRPTAGSRERRLKTKKQRSEIKRHRGRQRSWDD